MNKNLSLSLLIIFLAALSANAQKSVLFKMKYAPNRNYVSNIVMTTDMKMDFKGDSAELEKIKEGGGQLPVIMQNTMNMDFTFTTGSEDKLKIFPFFLTYNKLDVKQTVGGKEMQIPASPLVGQKIYGKFSADSKMSLDSASGTVLSDSLKKPLLDMMVKMQNAVQFPEKALNVGESFIQYIPINLPVAGQSMSINVKTAYKLSSIGNGIAIFDITQDMEMNMPIQGSNMAMKGAGTGKMEYFIKDNFIKKMDSDLTMSYDMPMSKLIMQGQAKIKSTFSVDIKM